MIGDQSDFQARLKAVLPLRWFSDETPVLDSVLSGLGAAWAWVYSLLEYVKAQTRIATATDVWLDVIAADFFGSRLARMTGEGDASLRHRISKELLRERATRNALNLALTQLTGRSPVIFEPSRPADTGGYGSLEGDGGGVSYNAYGGWGNLDLPFQCFVTAYRPVGGGIAEVTGWGEAAGSYGAGAIEYASLAMVPAQVTDANIYATVAATIPVATVAWTQIDN